MFIISLNYKCQLEEVDKHLDAHVAYLKNEYANGHFIASGRKIPRTGGVILSNVKTKNELEVILAKDPFYQAGIAEYDITEFTPTMVAEGFENFNTHKWCRATLTCRFNIGIPICRLCK